MMNFVTLRKLNVHNQKINIFKLGGYLDPEELIRRNTQKALAMIKTLSSVGVNPPGFSKLLCSRLYAHIVRPQLEYGLAINRFTISQRCALEEVQGYCVKKIYGSRGKASIKVMFHISKLPLMSERASILQAQFLFRSLYLPVYVLLACLLPYIHRFRGSQWCPPLPHATLENDDICYWRT